VVRRDKKFSHGQRTNTAVQKIRAIGGVQSVKSHLRVVAAKQMAR
jgi:hypothetical protein